MIQYSVWLMTLTKVKVMVDLHGIFFSMLPRFFACLMLHLYPIQLHVILDIIFFHLLLLSRNIFQNRYEFCSVAKILAKVKLHISDVPIIRNNRLINRKGCWLWWSILIFNNRSSDACTKHAITRLICTTRPQGSGVSDTDSLLEDLQ